ncbi:MAG TPA: hypothetical protein VGK30_10480 [Candidatus Binatia bacterium]|jgi:hypothetical protein
MHHVAQRSAAIVIVAALVFGASTGRGATSGQRFLAAVLAARSGAARQQAEALPSNKGIQETPDTKHILVSKDVGSDRWAISGNADDGTLSGNVFRGEGSPPAFVWCNQTGDDLNPDIRNRIATYACFGSDACPAAPCDLQTQWVLINDSVQLRGAFFLP